MDKERFIEVNYGNIKITVEGEGAVFGSLDLQVNAIKALISMMDFKFAEEVDEYAKDKVYLQILDAVGSLIKFSSLDPADKASKNIEVVQNYLNWITKEKIDELPNIKFMLDVKEDDDTDDLFDNLRKQLE